MRAIWKGAVSFGLVNVPVRLFTATQEHDIRFHQVHRADGGRIKMRRVCSVCGEEVSYDQLAKGFEAEDGRVVVLTDEDFEGLPLATGHEIDVVSFVPAEQVDPILYGRAYFLEPDSKAVKAYALLREALDATERVAVVKVALRQRESLAILRVRENVIMLQTLLWPDEVRAADFSVLEDDVELRPQELRMAASLVESMATDFEPDEFEDDYAAAVRELVEAKLEGVEPPSVETTEESATDVVDLLSALQASVDRARSARGEKPAPAAAKKAPAKKSAPASAAKKTTSPGPAKKTSSSAGAAKSAPGSAAKKAAPATKKTTSPGATKTAATKTAATKTAATKKAPARKSA